MMESWAGLTLTVNRSSILTQASPLASIVAYWLRDGRLSSAYHAPFGTRQLPVSEMRGAAGSHTAHQHSSEAPFWGESCLSGLQVNETETLTFA